MRKRKGKGCPITGVLQLIGDKWTILVIRDLAGGSKRTTEILSSLHPISSRTLMMRLRDMEAENLIERKNFGGNPPRVEYTLTERGLLFLPLLTELKTLGEKLGCSDCHERRSTIGDYCEACPNRLSLVSKEIQPTKHELDESVFLL